MSRVLVVPAVATMASVRSMIAMGFVFAMAHVFAQGCGIGVPLVMVVMRVVLLAAMTSMASMIGTPGVLRARAGFALVCLLAKLIATWL